MCRRFWVLQLQDSNTRLLPRQSEEVATHLQPGLRRDTAADRLSDCTLLHAPPLVADGPFVEAPPEEAVAVAAAEPEADTDAVPCLKEKAHFWDSISDDPFIRTTVRGFRMDFVQVPPLTYPEESRSRLGLNELDEEIRALLLKNAIEPVYSRSKGFFSHLFLVAKKGGGRRPIINLKPLNRFVRKKPFKMTTLKEVAQAIRPRDWTVTIDLKDAFLHIPVHRDYRRFLRFLWKGSVYQFCRRLSALVELATEEWKNIGNSTPRPGFSNRCLDDRLGCPAGTPFSPGEMVTQGENSTHKFPRADCSTPCVATLARSDDSESDICSDGQYHSSGLLDKGGRRSVSSPVRSGVQDTDFGGTSQHCSPSHVPTGLAEYGGRCPVSPKGFSRVDVNNLSGEETVSRVGISSGGPVCFSQDKTGSSVLHHGPSRPPSPRDGCSPSQVGVQGLPPLRLSTSNVDTIGVGQDTSVQDSDNNSDTLVAPITRSTSFCHRHITTTPLETYYRQ